MMERGAFISFEGIDGCGKSTQAAQLARTLEALGLPVMLTREPGGTAISEKIRSILLDPANAEMGDACELLLYEASRAQLVQERLVPALEAGTWVICDRYADSTYAYQAAGRGLDAALVKKANALGTQGLSPDLTLLLDMEPAQALARATKGGADRLEAAGLAFQDRIRKGYLELAEGEPERIRWVDAQGTEDEVASRCHAVLVRRFPELQKAGLHV